MLTALQRLSFPRATVLALVIAACVGAPSLFIGRFADDYLQLAELRGLAPLGGPLDVYRFADGDPSHIASIVQHGPYPWWTWPQVKLWFWRPLSSALSTLDDLAFGSALALHHLHSVLWYLALVAVVATLLKRTLPGGIGALALIIFALDDAHFVPVAWLANRNALVAATPAFLALWLHLRWREDGKTWALPASLLAWAVALTGGEAAIGVMAYAAAYEAFGAPGPLLKRGLKLAPLVTLLAGYALWYRTQGYGASGSGIYLDPQAHPLAWLTELLPRWFALVGGALLKFPSELATSLIWVHWLAWGAGALAVALFAAVAWRCVPLLEPEERRHVRWLVIGAALSFLPLASTFPSNRLLLVPSLGASVLVAIAIRVGAQQGRRLGPALIAVLHVALAVPGWAAFSTLGYVVSTGAERVATEAELDAAVLATQRVAVLAPPDPVVGAYVSLMRTLQGLPAPISWWPLTFTPIAQRITRTGPASFTLEPADADNRLGSALFDHLFRGPDHPLRTGDHVALEGLSVDIEAADDRGWSRVAFAFDRPLEDPSLVFLYWHDGKLRRYSLPAQGATQILTIENPIPLLQ